MATCCAPRLISAPVCADLQNQDDNTMPPTTTGVTEVKLRTTNASATTNGCSVNGSVKKAAAAAVANGSTHPRGKKNRPPLNDVQKVIQKVDYLQEYEAIYEPPEFSVKELRAAVPAHLFERSLVKSLAYTVLNLAAIVVMYFAATYIEYLPVSLRFIAWPVYWWFQGVGGVGIWILAHECGHQSFSDYKNLNNYIGFVLHTLVLVPYHPWRISHAQHHAGTANMNVDQAYVPRTRKEYMTWGNPPSPWVEAIETTPIFAFVTIIGMLLFGWPAYFFTNMSGQHVPGRLTTHIMPSSPLFQERHRWQVLASDLGILAWLGLLYWWGQETSFWTVTKYYGIPYLIVNAWLVIITFLQHTDVYIPHYSEKSWNFVRGALSTVDRDYGWFLNAAFHHIHDSHVAHHLFSQMPFYNAIEATPYLKEKLGEYYFYDQTPVWKAMWRAVRRCRYVEDDGDVLFYHQLEHKMD